MADRGPDGKFLPGNRANPHGRPPRKACLTDALRERLDRTVTLSDGQQTTMAQALASRLVAMALAGNFQALKLIWERVEGRPAMVVDLSADDGLRAIFSPLGAPPDESRGPVLRPPEEGEAGA